MLYYFILCSVSLFYFYYMLCYAILFHAIQFHPFYFLFPVLGCSLPAYRILVFPFRLSNFSYHFHFFYLISSLFSSYLSSIPFVYLISLPIVMFFLLLFISCCVLLIFFCFVCVPLFEIRIITNGHLSSLPRVLNEWLLQNINSSKASHTLSPRKPQDFFQTEFCFVLNLFNTSGCTSSLEQWLERFSSFLCSCFAAELLPVTLNGLGHYRKHTNASRPKFIPFWTL